MGCPIGKKTAVVCLTCGQATPETALRPFRGDSPAGCKGSVMAGPRNTLRSSWPPLAIWGKAGDSNMQIGLETMHVMNIHATM